jgi:hypothetical protein
MSKNTAQLPGSARVSRVGDGVAPSRNAGVAVQNEDYPWIWTQEDEARKESSLRRDSATSARDARATRTSSGNAP